MLCLIIFKKVWQKKKTFEIRTPRSSIVCNLCWLMQAFWASAFWTVVYIFLQLSPNCTRSSYMGLMFYLNCSSCRISFDPNWSIKILTKLILRTCSCGFKTCSKRTILPRRLEQKDWKKAGKNSMGFWTTKGFLQFQKSWKLSLLASIMMIY